MKFRGQGMAEEPAYLTMAEVATLLRLEQRRTSNLAKRGKLPGAIILPSGEVRFDRAILLDWLSKQASSALHGVDRGEKGQGEQR